MHILLTNDDGVHAPGLLAMYRALRKLGEVTVVAPDGERSSISQAITLDHPIYHRMVPFSGKHKAHAISGTPADCVKFAVAVLLKNKPDLVVSGINDGINDGCSVFYSGTIGAAREGALVNIPSIAVSLDSYGRSSFNLAAELGLKVARWVHKEGLPEGTFLNMNVPDVDHAHLKGITFAEQCHIPIHGVFSPRKDPSGRKYYWMTGRPPATKKEPLSDAYLLKKNYAVIVPVHCDTTDHVFLEKLRAKKEPFRW